MHGRLERADMWGLEEGGPVVQGTARSFALGGRARAARSSLLSNLLAGCVFRRKIDYGTDRARVAKRQLVVYSRAQKSRPALVLISTTLRKRERV